MNSMVAPCGKPGYVKISTGYLAKDEKPAIVPVATAIAMAKEERRKLFEIFPDGRVEMQRRV